MSGDFVNDVNNLAIAAEVTGAIEKEAPQSLVKMDGTPTPRGWHVLATKLQQPMPTKQRKGRGNLQFSFITARQVQERLDDTVGPGNWSTQYKVLHHEPTRNIVVVECSLTIFGVTKVDTGANNNPDIPEYVPVIGPDGNPVVDRVTGEVKDRKNPAWEDEPFKAAFSDSFKRAAVHWGIGRFLYND